MAEEQADESPIGGDNWVNVSLVPHQASREPSPKLPRPQPTPSTYVKRLRRTVAFEKEGPLGLNLRRKAGDKETAIGVPEGAALERGVCPGDFPVIVNGTDVAALAPEEIAAKIKGAGRPVSVTFERAITHSYHKKVVFKEEGPCGLRFVRKKGRVHCHVDGIPKSPALDLGVCDGDVVLSAGGEDVVGKTADEVVAIVKATRPLTLEFETAFEPPSEDPEIDAEHDAVLVKHARNDSFEQVEADPPREYGEPGKGSGSGAGPASPRSMGALRPSAPPPDRGCCGIPGTEGALESLGLLPPQ